MYVTIETITILNWQELNYYRNENILYWHEVAYNKVSGRTFFEVDHELTTPACLFRY